jgi:hypothetical protein
VVIPIVVVAVLIIVGILLWRKRKQNKAAEEARRKEVEDYGYNPNNDPTLPAIGAVGSDAGHEMSEDHSGGYRGWGAATTVAGAASSRKLSTTLSGGGHTQGQLSDAGSNMYGPSAHSPGYDAHSGDPLMTRDPRRETMSSEEMGSMGLGPIAGGAALGGGAAAAAAAGHSATNNNNNGVRRGPSNASSTYSAAAGVGGARSDVSDDRPDLPIGQAYDYNSGYGYTQHGPYGDGTYGGNNAPNDPGMPVVRDVSARRNTRIQQPPVGNYPQGNAGISQNF